MAKKCSVQSLSDNALAELANLVVSSIGSVLINTDFDNDIAITIVEINTYLELCGATGNIYEDLLRVILASDYLEASIRFTCMQMLLNGSVRILITEVFPFSYYEKILQVISAQGTGLRTLNLKGVWVKEEHMHYMFEIIRKCTMLSKLYIPYIANDELLEVIALYSPYLRILDISGETDITEIGLEYLSKGVACSNLSVIDIGMLGEENICHSDVAMLLESCPNLETLETYSYVGQSLKFIYENVDKNFTCKLLYIHDTMTDDEILDIIVKTCPKLENIYLDRPKSGILCKLKDTKCLRKLKLYKFSCSELLQLLNVIGENLDHLTLIKGNGLMDIENIARHCPALRALDCYMMERLSYYSDYKFNCLRSFEMLDCPIHPMGLRNFISSNSETLKKLAIDSVIFNDEDMCSIFIEHDFHELETIWFSSAPNLTVATVETLIDSCPELISIGQVSGWNLSPDDLVLIRGILKSSNSSIVLTPTSILS